MFVCLRSPPEPDTPGSSPQQFGNGTLPAGTRPVTVTRPATRRPKGPQKERPPVEKPQLSRTEWTDLFQDYAVLQVRPAFPGLSVLRCHCADRNCACKKNQKTRELP